jgi:hypothetical protein
MKKARKSPAAFGSEAEEPGLLEEIKIAAHKRDVPYLTQMWLSEYVGQGGRTAPLLNG